MTKLKDFFTKNISWKLGSVVIAFIVWFTVMNVQDPMRTINVSLPLEVLNPDVLIKENKILMNGEDLAKQTIVVSINGTFKETENAKNKLKAYVDLSLAEIKNAGPGTVRTNVLINKTGDYKFAISHNTPQYVELKLEPYVTVEKEVSIKITGKPASGYTFVPEPVSPGSVSITGAQSEVNAVRGLEVEVDIEGAAQNVTLHGKPKAYRYDGNESGAVIVNAEVDAKVAIYKTGIMKINQPTYTGTPAEGYVVTNIDWDPKEVKVMGAEDVINNMLPENLDPSENVNGATKTVEQEYDLRFYLLGRDINIMNGEEHKVKVKFTIEKMMAKDFTIPVMRLQITGYNSETQILTDEITVTVTGVESVMARVNEIAGYVDLSGLLPGEHQVPVNFVYPNGVSLAGEPPVIDVIIPGPNERQGEAEQEQGEEPLILSTEPPSE